MESTLSLPILYSLRYCPYAMRARLALLFCEQRIVLRDIVLKDKPKEMLDASPKGSVPVMVLPCGQVIDESLDIMWWAQTRREPIKADRRSDIQALINDLDSEFVPWLDRYKKAKRFREDSLEEDRNQCLIFIAQLEQRLCQQQFVMGEQQSIADLAVLPFIRQFSKVQRAWFVQTPYPNVQRWLSEYLQSRLFAQVMIKNPFWKKGAQEFMLGGD